MYSEFENKVYTESDDSKVTISDNTDFSISGSSKKLIFADALNEYVDIGFDSVDVSDYEEICLYLYTKRILTDENVLKVTIGTDEYSLKQMNKNQRFHFVKIPIGSLTTISSISITSLVENLVVFVDMPLYRKAAPETIDEDILKALADHISLEYGVSTTLSAQANAGSKTIYLTSKSYIYDNSLLRITGGGNTQDVMLESRINGNIRGTLQHTFPSGSTVEVLCPVKYGKVTDIEYNPVCAIYVSGKESDRIYCNEKLADGSFVKKMDLGALGITIYIEGESELKVLGLSRQFDRDYGKEFQFILDGQLVDMYILDSSYIGAQEGGFARSAYTYNIVPQPLTVEIGKRIDDLTVTVEGKAYEAS